MERADVRVRQPRDGARFLLEPPPAIRIRPREVGEHFDRDNPIEPGIARTIDLSHTTRAEQSFNAIRSDPSAGLESPHGDRRDGNRRRSERRSSIVMAGEELVDFYTKRRVVLAGLGEIRLASLRVTRERGVEDRGDLLPALGRHRG
jgi:hypothetical protein